MDHTGTGAAARHQRRHAGRHAHLLLPISRTADSRCSTLYYNVLIQCCCERANAVQMLLLPTCSSHVMMLYSPSSVLILSTR